MAERNAATPSGGKRARHSEPPRTLMQAHEALVRIRPKGNASLATWKSYYERSVALYQQIAEIDRGHHHEALYWADREQKSADEITARISADASPQERVPNPEWSKELEWNNKSTEVDIAAGHRPDNATKRITYFIPATK